MEIQRKIQRLQRLKTFEQRKLDLLAVEVKELDLVLQKQSEAKKQLIDQLDECSAYVGEGIDELRQSVVWVESLHQRIAQVQQAIEATNEQKNKLIEKIAEQRTAIRGWELLIERLEKQWLEEQENVESRIADDRFLGTQMVSDR